MSTFINDRCVYRFINSMPMIFAFRIVDCFFCMGPKVLFQVGYVTSYCVSSAFLTGFLVLVSKWFDTSLKTPADAVC